jgi:peptidoglycan/LPS O-acetylase OafA/YrhL
LGFLSLAWASLIPSAIVEAKRSAHEGKRIRETLQLLVVFFGLSAVVIVFAVPQTVESGRLCVLSVALGGMAALVTVAMALGGVAAAWHWKWPTDDSDTCPTCQQPLPPELVPNHAAK